MKGMVFTEFFDMVEKSWGITMVDDLVMDAQPMSEGAYTRLGTYDFSELVDLLNALSARTQLSHKQLLVQFGHYLAHSLAQRYPGFFADCDSTFALLSVLDNHIHVEVAKLYADASLPKFTPQAIDAEHFRLSYTSPRNLSDLAEGLILGCADFYGEQLSIEKQPNGVHQVDFYITRHGQH